MKKIRYGVARTEGGRMLRHEISHALHVPYTYPLDEYTIGLKDGSMMQTVLLDGFYFETEEIETLQRNANAFNSLLKRQRNQIYIYGYMIRRKASPKLEGVFPPGFSRELNDAYFDRNLDREMYVNEQYLTIVMEDDLPLMGQLNRLVANVTGRETSEQIKVRRAQMLLDLNQVVIGFMKSMSAYGACRLGTRIERQFDGEDRIYTETGRFLSKLINGDDVPFALPMSPLDEALCKRDWWFPKGKTFISQGAHEGDTRYGAMLSLKEYPSGGTMSGIMNTLLEVPFEVTMTQGFYPAKDAVVHQQLQLQRRQRIAAGDSTSVIESIDSAIEDLEMGKVRYGHHHATIKVEAKNRRELEERVAELLPIFDNVGITLVRESLNMEAAFWAQLPGNKEYRAPRGWSIISTKNIAGFLSFHNYAQGNAKGSYLGPPLTVLTTSGNTPYYLNLHIGMNGHTCIFGKVGSGKTTLASFLVSQTKKYGVKTIIFDKDWSWKPFVPAEDGIYSTIQPGIPTGWNPLQMPDTPANRGFVVGLLKSIETKALNRPLSPKEEEDNQRAVREFFTEFPDKADRRWGLLRELVLNRELQQVLKPWVAGNEKGFIFDNPEDTLSFENPMTGIDLGWVHDQEEDVSGPIVSYLLYRTEAVLAENVTLNVVFEEAWHHFGNAKIDAQAQNWALTMRKKGAFLFLISQEPNLGTSKAAAAIYKQSAAKMWLPPFSSDRKSYTEELGLTDAQYELMLGLPESSHRVLIKYGGETVLAVFDMSELPEYLSVLSGGRDRAVHVERLQAEYGTEARKWLPHYLEEHRNAKDVQLDVRRLAYAGSG